jgi:hypothetical protein
VILKSMTLRSFRDAVPRAKTVHRAAALHRPGAADIMQTCPMV